MPFRDYLSQKVAPTSMRRPAWARYIGALGDVADSAVSRAKEALKARFVSASPPDGVQAIGGERQMPPGSPYAAGLSVETTSAYRARISLAWNRWADGGNANGLLQALYDLGYTTAAVEIVGGRQYTLDGSRVLVVTALPSVGVGSWLIDTDRSFWSKVDVVFATPNLPATPTAPSNWAGGLPADGSDEMKALKACIRRWIPAMGQARIVVVTAGRCFGYPLGLTFGTLGGAGFGFVGNAVTLYQVD